MTSRYVIHSKDSLGFRMRLACDKVFSKTVKRNLCRLLRWGRTFGQCQLASAWARCLHFLQTTLFCRFSCKTNWTEYWIFETSKNLSIHLKNMEIYWKISKCNKISRELDKSIQCKLSRLWAVSHSQLSRVYISPFSHNFRNVKGKEISWSRLWIVNRKLLILYFLTDFLECEKVAGRSYHEASIYLCHPPCDICFKWVNNNGCIWFDLVTFNLASSLWYLL